MRKMSKLLFAAALAATAFLATPPKAVAVTNAYCVTCAADPTNCFACCRCAGGTIQYCTMWACH
jgi:hypothetical protein